MAGHEETKSQSGQAEPAVKVEHLDSIIESEGAVKTNINKSVTNLVHCSSDKLNKLDAKLDKSADVAEKVSINVRLSKDVSNARANNTSDDSTPSTETQYDPEELVLEKLSTDDTVVSIEDIPKEKITLKKGFDVKMAEEMADTKVGSDA